MIPLTDDELADYQAFWVGICLTSTVQAMKALNVKNRDSYAAARRDALHAYEMMRLTYRERIKLNGLALD